MAAGGGAVDAGASAASSSDGRVGAEREPSSEVTDLGGDDPGTRPRDLAGLTRWLARWLELEVSAKGMVEGHASPMDYLAHAVFELPGDPVVWANRGGGKTFMGAVATLLDMLFKPGIEVRILAGSLDQARRMHRHLRQLLDPRRHVDLHDAADPKFTERGLTLANGSQVELLAQSETSVRGTRVQKLRCDEAELFKPEIWEAAQLVTRSKVCGGIEVRGTVECLSTMQRPHGIMHRLIAEARDGRRVLYKWGVLDVLGSCGPAHRCGALPTEGPRPSDASRAPTAAVAAATIVSLAVVMTGDAAPCPLLTECGGRAKDPARGRGGHVPVADAIAMKQRVSVVRWDSEMMCLHPKRSDAVIPEFDQRRHVFEGEWWVHAAVPSSGGLPGEPAVEWVAGMDFGFRAPTVILWAVVDPRGVLWVVDEHCLAGAPLSDHLAVLTRGYGRRSERPWPRPRWIGVDPSGCNADLAGQSAVGQLRVDGWRVRARSSAMRLGLELVRARLHPAAMSADGVVGPRLYIHRRCQTLIESLERYHYDPKRLQDEKPVKDGHDHAVDALRYLVLSLDQGHRTECRNYAG